MKSEQTQTQSTAMDTAKRTRGSKKANRNPTRKADLALLSADPRKLFDENGRGRKLADLPKHIREQLARVDVDSDGRIRGFTFKDKMEAIERLLEM